MHIIYLLIKKQDMKSLLESLANWKHEGCAVVLAGDLEHRPDDGFIILSFDQPIPEDFRHKADMDPRVIDHIGIHIVVTHAITVQLEA